MKLVFLLLLGSILTSSTFSPQYLIWIAPFVPFLTNFERSLFILSSFLTWFYFRYWNDIIALQPMAISLLVTRNALLVLLFFISLLILIRKSK